MCNRKHSCEIILNLDQMSFNYFFLEHSIFSLMAILFGGGYYAGHLFELILNLDKLFKRCRLNNFLEFFSSSGRFVGRAERFGQSW